MKTRVGTCSLCGGDVMGVRGAWMSINPPPADECAACGAIARADNDVVPMMPRPFRRSPFRHRSVTAGGTNL